MCHDFFSQKRIEEIQEEIDLEMAEELVVMEEERDAALREILREQWIRGSIEGGL